MSEAIKAKLAPADWERFSRLHANFTGYRSETTLARFYGFVFSHGLQADINAFRFQRMASVLRDLMAELRPGLSVLDIGAGAGFIASVAMRNLALRDYVVADPCREARDELAAQGFTVLPHPPPSAPDAALTGGGSREGAGGFDLLLCIDSLGEINGDDDGLLAKPDAVEAGELPALMEQRYGFAWKLRPWRPYLAPGGRILLWEPFAYPAALEALAVTLRQNGWTARLVSRAPGRNYLELAAN